MSSVALNDLCNDIDATPPRKIGGDCVHASFPNAENPSEQEISRFTTTLSENRATLQASLNVDLPRMFDEIERKSREIELRISQSESLLL